MASVTKWGVTDFKALSGATLELSPLTILTGANSSGKSSILQSLLLLGQTVSRGGSVVLNGPLVRLGLPKDVVRNGQKTTQLKLSVKVDMGTPRKPKNTEVSVSLSLTPDTANSVLVLSALEITNPDDGSLLFAATAERMNSADVATICDITNVDSSYLRVTTLDGKKAPSRIYLSCVGLLPASLIVHRDKATIKRQMLGALRAFSGSERMPFEVVQEIGRFVDRDLYFREIGKEIPAEDVATHVAQRAHSPNARWSLRDFRMLNSDELDILLQKAAIERSKSEWIVVSVNQFGYYSSGLRFRGPTIHSDGALEDLISAEYENSLLYLMNIGQALQIFGSSVKYLGPLRDEPKVVHGVWDERVESLPVGIRGELTAEVLTRRRSDQIKYRDWNNESAMSSLPDAVAHWCKYLGLGDHINVLDRGKQGRGIELRVNGVDRDLTTIGVGASQLLPVLVAGLTVPAGSVVMVEQPELHLHPKVQSRLADFFLYARPNVRFLVETHSEYLITRIRRRVAEGKVNPAKVNVMFAEQHHGATNVRTLGMSEFGDFEMWPDGFFDAQDDDSMEIVRAVSLRLGGNA